MIHNKVKISVKDGNIHFDKSKGELNIDKLIKHQCGYETIFKLNKDETENLYFNLKEFFEK